jgi:hypothetical protein
MPAIIEPAIVHTFAHFREKMAEFLFFDVDHTQFPDARRIDDESAVR